MHILDFKKFALASMQLKKENWQCSRNLKLYPPYGCPCYAWVGPLQWHSLYQQRTENDKIDIFFHSLISDCDVGIKNIAK